ncbi:MAG: PA14 domain-containing protein, partial [Enhygromyxa sp.]
ALHTEVPGTGPWRAAYHADTAFESRPVLVREDSVEHDWKDTAPHEKIAPDKFAVRWDTCLRLDEEPAGPVVLQVNANDGARVFVDGEQVIDAWDRDPKGGRRGFGSAELELEAGVHHLRVEYFESLGDAHIKLSASLDGSLPGPLPRERLSYPGDDFDESDPCAAVR